MTLASGRANTIVFRVTPASGRATMAERCPWHWFVCTPGSGGRLLAPPYCAEYCEAHVTPWAPVGISDSCINQFMGVLIPRPRPSTRIRISGTQIQFLLLILHSLVQILLFLLWFLCLLCRFRRFCNRSGCPGYKYRCFCNISGSPGYKYRGFCNRSGSPGYKYGTNTVAFAIDLAARGTNTVVFAIDLASPGYNDRCFCNKSGCLGTHTIVFTTNLYQASAHGLAMLGCLCSGEHTKCSGMFGHAQAMFGMFGMFGFNSIAIWVCSGTYVRSHVREWTCSGQI